MVKFNNGDTMITNYVVKEDQIILYLDYSFEMGSLDNNNKKSVLNQIYDYLKNTKINLDGKKIILMLGSTLVATLIYTGGVLRPAERDILISTELAPVTNEIESPINNEVGKEAIEDYEIIEQKEKEPALVEEVKQSNASSNQSHTNSKITNQSSKVNNQNTSQNNSTTSSNNQQTSSDILSEQVDNSNIEDFKTVEPENIVTVYRSNGTVLQIEMEEYLVGVVAAEMPASFNIEALKAQAVIARTYALKRISQGQVLTDTVSTQSYIDTSQMKNKWGSEYTKYYNKIVEAVSSTKGEYVTYNGKYIEAVYHSTSNGYTEDAKNVWGTSYPYLKSVESSWDKSASSYLKIENKEFQTVMQILGLSFDENTEISIISRNKSGRVSEVKIGNTSYTGVELRTLLGLRSADFDIEVNNEIVTIITRGYGHGVGMSQYGANGMANSGYSYKDIIKHYYTGVVITK